MPSMTELMNSMKARKLQLTEASHAMASDDRKLEVKEVTEPKVNGNEIIGRRPGGQVHREENSDKDTNSTKSSDILKESGNYHEHKSVGKLHLGDNTLVTDKAQPKTDGSLEYQQGWNAAKHGIQVQDNPYLDDAKHPNDKWLEWDSGWKSYRNSKIGLGEKLANPPEFTNLHRDPDSGTNNLAGTRQPGVADPSRA